MTPENKERNVEIYIRHSKDGYSFRRLGKIYRIHWTTVQNIVERYRILEKEGKFNALAEKA